AGALRGRGGRAHRPQAHFLVFQRAAVVHRVPQPRQPAGRPETSAWRNPRLLSAAFGKAGRMTAAVKATSRRTALPVGLEVILNSIPDAVLVLDSADNVVYANMTAEDFFFMSVGTMTRLKLSDLVAFGSPLLTL